METMPLFQDILIFLLIVGVSLALFAVVLVRKTSELDKQPTYMSYLQWDYVFDVRNWCTKEQKHTMFTYIYNKYTGERIRKCTSCNRVTKIEEWQWPKKDERW